MSALSYFFPGAAQTFWDDVLERTISDNFATVSASASAAPLASFLLVDLAISVGFVAYSLFSVPVLATLVALMVAKKVARKA